MNGLIVMLDKAGQAIAAAEAEIARLNDDNRHLRAEVARLATEQGEP